MLGARGAATGALNCGEVGSGRVALAKWCACRAGRKTLRAGVTGETGGRWAGCWGAAACGGACAADRSGADRRRGVFASVGGERSATLAAGGWAPRATSRHDEDGSRSADDSGFILSSRFQFVCCASCRQKTALPSTGWIGWGCRRCGWRCRGFAGAAPPRFTDRLHSGAATFALSPQRRSAPVGLGQSPP